MTSKFDATPSMLGYLYQCQYALLYALRKSKSKPTASLSIERFDDIAIEEGDGPTELLQAKHHSGGTKLTDKSEDLWSTIRVWVEAMSANPQLPFETILLLITTDPAPVDSAAARLRDDGERSIPKARQYLDAAAKESTNKATQEARNLFTSLSSTQKEALLDAVYVFDKSPNISDVQDELEEQFHWAVPQQHREEFITRLVGWWMDQVIFHLCKDGGGAISLLELTAKVDDLRETFSASSLPLMELDEDDAKFAELIAKQPLFIKQMNAVNLSSGAIQRGARDFYKATTTRSQWVRESLLLDDQISTYEEELVDAWGRKFDQMQDDLPERGEAEIVLAGRKLFHDLNQSVVALRNRTEQWLTSGSYQILANRLSVGWRIDYQSIFSDSNEEGGDDA